VTDQGGTCGLADGSAQCVGGIGWAVGANDAEGAASDLQMAGCVWFVQRVLYCLLTRVLASL
jgi:hypothetical protein